MNPAPGHGPDPTPDPTPGPTADRPPNGTARRPTRRRIVTTLGAAALTAAVTPAAAAATRSTPSASSGAAAYEILVFTRTAGFRHDSIPQGVTALRRLGAENDFAVTTTEDPAAFTTAGLARYRAVVFLSTTGDVLGPAQQTAFEGYLRAGGGYAGVHAAADTEYTWPWYGGLVGAYFASHPAIQPATVTVEDRTHDATAHLAATWRRTDEWYNYRTNPRPAVRVLASLNESSYTGGTMGGDHPIAWCHDYQGGRSFYTGLGHTAESYAEPAFLRHLLGGVRWAAGMA
ncbi:ThuA domain-containing protein [Streptomyces sp. PLAI1-29]|uniref:ThuA domain-containing protein n=1 Tax=Streptomyces zingiberis TaxID=2053010 RepID=A0ABX1BWY7_9ACTN|nr:ThuA domain-containing protein [Streptomyces zingiberis]